MSKQNEPVEVSASDLKNAWHEFLSQVSTGRQEVVVTRYGHPIARLSPYDGPKKAGGVFGCLAGSVTVHGDLIAPIDENWDADG